MDEGFFAALPDGDPHHASAKRVPKKKRLLKRDRPLPLFEESA
jgi:hypothetical protein